MKPNNPPAFPILVDIRNGQEEQFDTIFGMTLRDYFAAKAPSKIPQWFKPERKDKPREPKSWVSLPESDPNKTLLKDWTHDGCYDLPDELKWYQDAWESYRMAVENWEVDYQIERYFSWKFFYADAMLDQREKGESNG